ncbi:class I SAM-dependent methyltransferase [Candidatus Uhrbacteria bacterium]|jgi:release factor glutamine methyltransferase|nr:class I SAM-dependent methyltransferase [Candidatus Uhrbacteria bacterium]
MKPYQEYLEGTEEILKASRAETDRYETEVLGRNFIVHPNVFSPKYFKDTEPFAKHLPITEGQTMLEIGPGTGAVSITAVHRGAKHVTAIDINSSAVANVRENIQLHNMQDQIDVRFGDVYSALQPNEKFDVIFWNTPFGLIPDNAEITDLQRSVYDPGYMATERFILDAKQHLNPGGVVYIGFSSTLGKLDLIESFAERSGFTLKKIFEIDSTEKHQVKFEIFKAELRT